MNTQEIDRATYITLKQLEYSINVNTRTFYLEGEIDIETPSVVKERIQMIVDLSGDAQSPITMQISCYGGDIYGLLGTLDVLATVPMKINTFGVGAVMSAAAFLLAAGTGKRTLGAHTAVMIHEISTWIMGTSKDIITEASNMKDLQKQLYGILEKYSNKKAKFWENKSKVNLYLNAQQCLDFGLIDEIIGGRD